MKILFFITALFFVTATYAQSKQPLSGAFAITTKDTTNLDTPAKELYICVSGDVKVTMANNDSAIVFKAVPVGILPVYVKKVYKTGTTATNIIGLK
jgi:hypothetical protein